MTTAPVTVMSYKTESGHRKVVRIIYDGTYYHAVTEKPGHKFQREIVKSIFPITLKRDTESGYPRIVIERPSLYQIANRYLVTAFTGAQAANALAGLTISKKLLIACLETSEQWHLVKRVKGVTSSSKFGVLRGSRHDMCQLIADTLASVLKDCTEAERALGVEREEKIRIKFQELIEEESENVSTVVIEPWELL